MHRRTFLAALGAGLATPARLLAQAGGLDPWYNALVADRGRYDKAIHLFGDSIFRGYATGIFADQMSPDHPLYGFRSPSAVANAILADSGLPHIVAYGGAAGDAEGVPEKISDFVAVGLIRPGDTVVFEDAGAHSGDPAAYQAALKDLRWAASGWHDITSIFLTTFDYPPAPLEAQYDAPIDGGLTMNDAVRAAAKDDGTCIGQSRVLEMNAIMDNWRYSAKAADNVEVMQADGVHPNVWGQMRLVGEILKAVGLRPYCKSCATAVAIARANFAALSYGSTTFTADRAQAYVNGCLLR